MAENNKQNGFKFRNFVSVVLTLAFIAMGLTGLALFVTPPGRFAHWTGWRLVGLGKEQWGAMHICFGAIFLIVSILHLYLNWKPLLNYFKGRVSKKFALRGEWILGIAFCMLVFAGILSDIPPFSSLMSLHNKIKFGWEKPEERAPIPHAETLALGELAKLFDMEVETLLENLHIAGIKEATKETALNELAKIHGMTPDAAYRVALGKMEKPKGVEQGQGCGDGQKRRLGIKTLGQFCKEESISVDDGLAKLSAAGIEASANETLRKLADKAGSTPGVIAAIIEKTK